MLILVSTVSVVTAHDANKKEFKQNIEKSAYCFTGGMYLEGTKQLCTAGLKMIFLILRENTALMA